MSDIVIFSIGHSNHSIDTFIALLKQHNIDALADIRRFPSSRRHPHFNRPSLEKSLGGNGIDYHWLESLGGHRKKRLADSPNFGIRDESFRNYADHMLGEEFRGGADQLLEIAQARKTAMMCAESSFHQCHRKLLSDFLVANGVRVQHLLPTGKLESHKLGDGAKVEDGMVTYPESHPLLIECRELWNEPMQQWYIEKRKAIDEVFAKAEPKLDEIKSMVSPSGRYSLEVIPHSTGPRSWGYSKGIVRLVETGEQLAGIKRNYGAFPYSWAESHPTGHDYLIAGEDYQGQTIIELDTGNRLDHAPDAAEKGFGFCWTAHYPTRDGRFIFVDGCIWAGPYQLVLHDFSNPMDLPYKELNRWPVWDVDGFQPDGSFVWEYNVEVRTSDGKQIDEMTEEEEEAFEADDNYDSLLGERTIRMKWHPDGHAEIVGEVEKET